MSAIADVIAERARYTVVTGDVIDVLRTLPDAVGDSAFFDPPYGLGQDPSRSGASFTAS